MRITVRLFAILRERAGTSELILDLSETSNVARAADEIVARAPALRDFLPRVVFAVNREYAARDTPLRDGDELALIPPVSGG